MKPSATDYWGIPAIRQTTPHSASLTEHTERRDWRKSEKPESSGTAMFTYAMIVGVRHGWLDAKEYGDCARRGWIGLCSYLNENGSLREVCVGTVQRNDTNYYLNRPRSVGDLHGQAPVLWCAWALLQK